MKNSETKDFIAYEYLSINVESEKEPLYTDCYENFGWILINNSALIDKDDYYLNNYNNRKIVKIKFKRDRKIKNKTELLSLQRKLDKSLKELDELMVEENKPKRFYCRTNYWCSRTYYLCIKLSNIFLYQKR